MLIPSPHYPCNFFSPCYAKISGENFLGGKGVKNQEHRLIMVITNLLCSTYNVDSTDWVSKPS